MEDHNSAGYFVAGYRSTRLNWKYEGLIELIPDKKPLRHIGLFELHAFLEPAADIHLASEIVDKIENSNVSLFFKPDHALCSGVDDQNAEVRIRHHHTVF